MNIDFEIFLVPSINDQGMKMFPKTLQNGRIWELVENIDNVFLIDNPSSFSILGKTFSIIKGEFSVHMTRKVIIPFNRDFEPETHMLRTVISQRDFGCFEIKEFPISKKYREDFLFYDTPNYFIIADNNLKSIFETFESEHNPPLFGITISSFPKTRQFVEVSLPSGLINIKSY